MIGRVAFGMVAAAVASLLESSVVAAPSPLVGEVEQVAPALPLHQAQRRGGWGGGGFSAPVFRAPAPVYRAPAPVYRAPAPAYRAPSAPAYRPPVFSNPPAYRAQQGLNPSGSLSRPPSVPSLRTGTGLSRPGASALRQGRTGIFGRSSVSSRWGGATPGLRAAPALAPGALLAGRQGARLATAEQAQALLLRQRGLPTTRLRSNILAGPALANLLTRRTLFAAALGTGAGAAAAGPARPRVPRDDRASGRGAADNRDSGTCSIRAASLALRAFAAVPVREATPERRRYAALRTTTLADVSPDVAVAAREEPARLADNCRGERVNEPLPGVKQVKKYLGAVANTKLFVIEAWRTTGVRRVLIWKRIKSEIGIAPANARAASQPRLERPGVKPQGGASSLRVAWDSALPARKQDPGARSGGLHHHLAVPMLARSEIFDRDEKVEYFDPKKQEAHRVIADAQGRMTYAQTGKRLTIRSAIYVMDVHGNLYVTKPQVGQVHHSSLSAGGAIVGAGEISVSDGRVLRLDDSSGHYGKNLPRDRVHFVAGELSKDGFDLKEAKVVNFDPW